MLDAEDALGTLHLAAAYGRDVVGEVVHERLVRRERRVQDVSTFSARTADDQDLDTLADVARHRRGALARLVVGVGVHGHQPQRPVELHLGHHGIVSATAGGLRAAGRRGGWAP